jgi:hypothetical protein
MEALSGRTVEELYKEPEEKWKDISKLASDILYGVSGNKKDSRDWYKIMSANDIITEAQSETKKMHNPSVDIVSEKSTSGTVLAEYAVIKDGEGEILRTLAGSTAEIQVTLENFGATGNAIPEGIEKKITSDKFDRKVLTFLQTLSKQSLENIALETTAKAMSARYSNNIPLAEIEKL